MGKLVMSNPKNEGTFFIAGMNVFIANDAESMVQETCGHALIPFFFRLGRLMKESLMSFFFN
jgi:hypothetical protein